MSIDEYPGANYDYKLVTSASRPANPIPGQMIYELDTKIVYLWTGTNWREISAPRYAARVYRTANLNVAAGFASTVVPMDTLSWADDNVVFQGSNYTCPIAGLYEATLNVETNSGIMMALSLLGLEGSGIPVSSARATRLNMTAVASMNAGAVIQPSIWNDGDVASTIRVGHQFTWMIVRRIGPRHDSGAA